jgi:hypothetical protein
MGTTSDLTYCTDLAERSPDAFPGCCDSCHDDADEGYFPLEPDECGMVVCCFVASWLARGQALRNR